MKPKEKDTDLTELHPADLGEVEYCPVCGAVLIEDNDCYECGWCDED